MVLQNFTDMPKLIQTECLVTLNVIILSSYYKKAQLRHIFQVMDPSYIGFSMEVSHMYEAMQVSPP